MTNLVGRLTVSWACIDGGIHNNAHILQWIQLCNKNAKVSIKKIGLQESDTWGYNEQEGHILNKSRSFFSITGVQKWRDNRLICEQPIIIQSEIGYLGIICKNFNGVLHFLMQAKIEPGNINHIQLSPTIQATKSNFTQKHGGKVPLYLEYFLNAGKYNVVVDQIQSEQSSRFWKKRNRNIIIEINEEIEVSSNHKWMTLGQIKYLMKYDNLVNMDTRTVLSCIPFSTCWFDMEVVQLEKLFSEKEFYRSVFEGSDKNIVPQIYQYINNYKMFNESENHLIPLFNLQSWEMKDDEFRCKQECPFKVVFCDIEIDGREVQRWTQPLFEAIGMATFGLIMCDVEGVRKFLVKCTPEIGSFDRIEIGPTIQYEFTENQDNCDSIGQLFWEKLLTKEGIYYDVMLSEEGGRFFHEQNRNVILKVMHSDLPEIPEGYFLVDYKTLNWLVQINNCLNIQLRNLLSLLEV